MESSSPPQDASPYTLKENEVKPVRSKYNPETGESKGLYETIGYLVVRGSSRRCSSITVMTLKNQECFIHITKGEFQTLFPGPYLIVIGR